MPRVRINFPATTGLRQQRSPLTSRVLLLPTPTSLFPLHSLGICTCLYIPNYLRRSSALKPSQDAESEPPSPPEPPFRHLRQPIARSIKAAISKPLIMPHPPPLRPCQPPTDTPVPSLRHQPCRLPLSSKSQIRKVIGARLHRYRPWVPVLHNTG